MSVNSKISGWLAILLIGLAFICPFTGIAAEASVPRFLITYDNDNGKENARRLVHLMGHFQGGTHMASWNETLENNGSTYDFIVVLDNHVNESLRQQLDMKLQGLPIPVLWIGAGEVKQSLLALSLTYEAQAYPVNGLMVYFKDIQAQDEVLSLASDGIRSSPLILRNQNRWYMMSSQVTGITGLLLADVLHDILVQPHDSKHQGYILVQNVNPLTSAQKLHEITEVFIKRKIPFLVAVTPIYVYPLTSTLVSLEERPDVVKALLHMQNSGGSIILNGLTHQYKHTATGNSYEFWDALEDKPIEDEESVIKEKLNKGIAILIKLGLYPVGFEPPLYAMSQKGYQIVSTYFSHLYGQLQISDQSYLGLQSVPYVMEHRSSGLQLFPETLGDPRNEQGDIEKLLRNIDQLQIVRDSFYGMLFHTDSSLDLLEQAIDSLYKEPIDYLNPLYGPLYVHTSFMDMASNGFGELKITISNPDELSLYATSPEQESTALSSFTYLLTWSLAMVVAVFIVLFIGFLFLLNRRRRYRLFTERTLTVSERK
ncbi:DUF2334 domain-containing protein [Paenibacillus agricola]|uniref:DUF2334 domain-containing protein n=1 Tax=Paenibacillus agricola TaxID=2716264 RepID=A0ABX0JHW0_9BACL|nr:DUF2334 domain-containing protein [Paenibacillus agricola]NHN33446.1 DUF2334 domain-containing protein [Paenibacillus agricola]